LWVVNGTTPGQVLRITDSIGSRTYSLRPGVSGPLVRGSSRAITIELLSSSCALQQSFVLDLASDEVIDVDSGSFGLQSKIAYDAGAIADVPLPVSSDCPK
jgi:hypothetical protein